MAEAGGTQDPETRTLGKLSATALIANAAIGAGILNFPEAFKFAGGAVVGMILQIVLIFFVVSGLIALAILTNKFNCTSMQDIMMITTGKRWHLFSTITIILYSFFCCVAYHIVLGDQFDRVLYNAVSTDFCHTWYLNRKFTILAASLLVMFPFLFPKKIDFLKYISQIGVIAILYVIFLVVFKYFTGKFDKGSVTWLPTDYARVTMTIPPFCFAYHAHIQSVPVFWCMKDQSIKGLLLVCYAASFCCMLLYTLTGAFGYLTFGSLVKSNILVNYPAKDAIVIIAIVIVALKICTVYPVVVFCGRDAVIDIYLEVTQYDRETNNLQRRIVVSTIWFFLAVALALFFPSIGVVIDVLGFFVAFFMFVFPGIAFYKHLKTTDSPEVKLKVALIILVILGVIVATMSLCVVLWRLIAEGEEHQLLCS